MPDTAPDEILAAKRRVSDTVADLIMSRILNGEYAEGDYLPSEKDMMRAFDVGRVSIREAIASLRWRGFLIVKQGDRPKITRPDSRTVIEQTTYVARALLAAPEGVMHFNQARLIFEEGVVQFVVSHASDAQVATIAEVQRTNATLLDDPEAFIEGDIAFHRALVNVTENPILISSHMALVEWLILDRLRKSHKNPDESHREHGDILAAIESRDAAQAAQAVRDHLDRTITPGT